MSKMLKILHTGDWHLGKKLYQKPRHEEHQLFLDWLIQTITKESIDILIISGDIFDLPNPPHRSLRQFYHFIEKFIAQSNAHLYAIAGNHDSGALLEATNPLLKNGRVHIVGPLHYDQLTKHFHKFEFSLENKKINLGLCLLPFFRSVEFEKLSYSKEGQTYANNDGHGILHSLKSFLEEYEKFKAAENISHSILVAHHLFGNFMPSGSEQGLNLSGLETIPLKILDDYFDYLALGHIHKPQILKHNNPTAIYPGSPLAMRFSELKQSSSKEIRLVVINQENKEIEHRPINIPFFRPLIQIEGSFDNHREEFEQSQFVENLEAKLQTLYRLIKDAKVSPCWIECRIWAAQPQSDLFDLMNVYIEKNFSDIKENIECIQFQVLLKTETSQGLPDKGGQSLIENITTEDLFKKYYLKKFEETKEVPDEIIEDLNEVLEIIRQDNDGPEKQTGGE